MEDTVITSLIVILMLTIIFYFYPKRRPLNKEEKATCKRIIKNAIEVGMRTDISDSMRYTYQQTALKMIDYLENGYYRHHDLTLVLDELPPYFKGVINTDKDDYDEIVESSKPTVEPFYNKHKCYMVYDEDYGWLAYANEFDYTHNGKGQQVNDFNRTYVSDKVKNYKWNYSYIN